MWISQLVSIIIRVWANKLQVASQQVASLPHYELQVGSCGPTSLQVVSPRANELRVCKLTTCVAELDT